ncbi:MAG: hypothetical protein GY696_11385 [Gammaproteobacteria bacterium]|nr:hypothetical protein [Gammaproteobacteria bacterium]
MCDTLVAQIYSLNSPADSVAELRSFYDAVEGNLRALESRGKDVNANDALRLFIQKRLPVTVRIEMEKLRESAEWTLPLLVTLLRRHITQREAVEIVLFETQYDSPEHKFHRSGGQGTFRSSAQNLATGSDRRERTTNSLCCAFCKEKHFPSECDEYSDLTSRKEIVRNRKLCWKCLRAGHQSSECYRDKRCWYCKQSGHHQALCPVEFEEKTGQKEQKQEKPESDGPGKASSFAGSTAKDG